MPLAPIQEPVQDRGYSPSQSWPLLILWLPYGLNSRLDVSRAARMQGLSLAGVILFLTGFALPCLSLPYNLQDLVSPATISEGLGDQVNSSFVEEDEVGEEEEEEIETKLEAALQVGESVRNQQVTFHNDSHGTLVSKGW